MADNLCPWLAHEHPDRPFDTWTWLDDCHACVAALQQEAAARPRTLLCLKTHYDRILVTAEYLAEWLVGGHPIEALCFMPGDWVREVFVPVNGSLPPSARWWSLCRWEEERSVAAVLGGRTRADAGNAPDG